MPRKLIAYVCEVCEKPFRARSTESKYCSLMCSGKAKMLAARRRLNEEAARTRFLDTQPVLPGKDSYVLFCDAHCPRHNSAFMESMLEVIREKGITKGVCIGDLFDFDELSGFLKLGLGITPIESLEAGVNVAGTLVDFLDELHVLLGNHDVRLGRKLNQGDISDPFGFMAKVVDRLASNPKIKYHMSTNLVINTSPIPFKLVHPDSYSRIVPQVERLLAAKYHMNIIGTHGHLVGIGFDISGKFLVAQIGCMCLPQKMEYVQQKLTTHPNWQNAFATLIDGQLMVYVDHPSWRWA